MRALSWWHGEYLIVGGHYRDGGISRLYTWDGLGAARRIDSVSLDGFNAEAFFTPEERGDILLFGDDGTAEIDGQRCKDLQDPSRQRPRGRWVNPPASSVVGR